MSSRAFPIWIKNVDVRNGFNFGSQDRKIHLPKKKKHQGHHKSWDATVTRQFLDSSQ
jgi:hypothetical protein